MASCQVCLICRFEFGHDALRCSPRYRVRAILRRMANNNPSKPIVVKFIDPPPPPLPELLDPPELPEEDVTVKVTDCIVSPPVPLHFNE